MPVSMVAPRSVGEPSGAFAMLQQKGGKMGVRGVSSKDAVLCVSDVESLAYLASKNMSTTRISTATARDALTSIICPCKFSKLCDRLSSQKMTTSASRLRSHYGTINKVSLKTSDPAAMICDRLFRRF